MTKKKVNTPGLAVESAIDYKPRIHLDLDDDDAEMMKDLSVGDKVKVTVTGTVFGLSQRKPYDAKDGVRGDLDVEIKDVKVESGKNVFKDLANDGD